MEMKINTANLDKTFLALPRSTRNKVLRPALRVGAKVVQTAAVVNVKRVAKKKSTGLLARSIVVRAMKQFRGLLRMSVQIRKGTTYPHKTDKNGPVRVAAVGAILEYRDGGKYSWLRKAAREKVQAALDAVKSEANRRMVDAVRDAKQ